jgi:hypothetical protein
MANRKQSDDNFAGTTVLPTYLRPDRVEVLDDAAAEAHGRYQEYVRSLDEVPVLVDVVREPPHVAVLDFRLGQRPDARKAARADVASLRDQHASDVAVQYAEYVESTEALTTKRARPRKVAKKRVGKTRTQKKRAKRTKRSARSTS